MKKSILAIAVLMGVSAANFSFAGDKVSNSNAAIELVASNDLKFKLTLDNVKEKSYMLIKGDNGIVYSLDIPKTDSYTKIFDLSNLADGDYAFVVYNGKDVVEKPFSIATETKRLVTAVVK